MIQCPLFQSFCHTYNRDCVICADTTSPSYFLHMFVNVMLMNHSSMIDLIPVIQYNMFTLVLYINICDHTISCLDAALISIVCNCLCPELVMRYFVLLMHV